MLGGDAYLWLIAEDLCHSAPSQGRSDDALCAGLKRAECSCSFEVKDAVSFDHFFDTLRLPMWLWLRSFTLCM